MTKGFHHRSATASHKFYAEPRSDAASHNFYAGR
jgi:hypothetical protein